MARYDAVVVGAGPAGSATAAHLASAGLDVLLLDRTAFPRDKACGGGLTPRGAAALDRLGVATDGPAFVEVGGLEMRAAGRSSVVGFPSTSRWPARGLVARRFDLDAAVLAAAVKAGCDFRQGTRVLGPVMEDGICRGVRLAGERGVEEVAASQVIAADGATSVMARGAGLARPGTGFWYKAIRGYFGPVAPRVSGARPVIEFYPLRTPDGRWLPAYGWVFPLPDGAANVGVDLPHRPKLAESPMLRAAYAAFVEELRRHRPGFEGAVEEAPPVGALLPEGMRSIRPGAPGLLLTGDAAGLITPYSGEGIVYALESAELAARAILDARRPSGVLEAYREALWRGYGFQFRTALWFMKGVRRPALARTAAWMGVGHPRVLRAAVRIMAFLIEEDPAAPPSTVSKVYRGARKVIRVSADTTWG